MSTVEPVYDLLTVPTDQEGVAGDVTGVGAYTIDVAMEETATRDRDRDPLTSEMEGLVT